MKRTHKLFCRLKSQLGVPVIVDRCVEDDVLRVRYGEKIQVGRAVYPTSAASVGEVVGYFLSDLDMFGRRFRSLRRDNHSHTEQPA